MDRLRNVVVTDQLDLLSRQLLVNKRSIDNIDDNVDTIKTSLSILISDINASTRDLVKAAKSLKSANKILQDASHLQIEERSWAINVARAQLKIDDPDAYNTILEQERVAESKEAARDAFENNRSAFNTVLYTVCIATFFLTYRIGYKLEKYL